MMRTCDLGWRAVDNNEDIAYFLLVLFDHLIESTVDAFQLIQRNVLFRTCLCVW